MKAISRKRLAITSASIAMIAVVLVVTVWRMNASDSAEPALPSGSDSQSVSPAEATSRPVNMQKLVGRWLRTDSSYIIEIREISPDGTLRAGYYNPRPINVSAAKVEDKNGALKVFAELHDAGYPGSNYTLDYNARNDVLEGTYFQATMRQNFDVTFMRMPAER